MRRTVFAALLAGLAALAAPAAAESPIAPRDGWEIAATEKSFAALAKDLDAAIKANKMGRVTRASASDGARMAGVEIPGNLVIGVYRNDFARRMLEASVAAGIEAPIRFYVVETDGGAPLAYKTPSAVFAPYVDEGGDALRTLAAELDGIFAKIAADALK